MIFTASKELKQAVEEWQEQCRVIEDLKRQRIVSMPRLRYEKTRLDVLAEKIRRLSDICE